jgi:hypothetical protein
VHVLTQRVTDWFDSRIGRTIQNVAASKWFGQMEARELYEIAPSLGISPEERDRIAKAGQGEGLLVTTGRRGSTCTATPRPANSLWPTPTCSPVLTSTTSETHRTGGTDMLRKLLRTPGTNGVEVGVAIPIGCMVPLAIAAAALVVVGVIAGGALYQRERAWSSPDRVTVRVIDDGAAGGPQVVSTQVVPLR